MADLSPNSEQVQLDPWLNRLLGGKYRVLARLGAGGMGLAYRAWDTERGLPVVVKIPKKSLLEDPTFAERFHRETRTVQGISHPRVVPIVDVGEYEGVPYVVMQFLPGGSLANRRLRNAEGEPAANPPGMLHLWLPQIAEALDHVHSLGIVHRDVKPENIFFDARWGAFLGDFGIAKIVEESAAFSRDQTLTATSMAIGTQQYMAPEQFQPKAAVDGRTDQYALAVTVYEVLSGERPFRGETSNLIVEIMTTPAPSLAARRLKLPPSLVAAVQRGLSKQPGERFSSCQGFVDAVLENVKELPDEPDIARLMCPSCGNILKLRPDAAGRKGNCPKCRVPMRVARDLESLWVAGEDGGQTALNTGSGSGLASKSGGVFKTISGGVAAWPWRGGIQGALGRMVAGPRWVLALSALVAGVLCIVAATAILAWISSQAPPAGQVAGGIQSLTGTAPAAAEVSTETEEPPLTPAPPAVVVVADPLADARAAIDRNPQDIVAHGVLGRILCFGRERWDEGLEHLAQCDTPALATIARREIDARTQPAEARPGELLRVAKAWWDLRQGGFLPAAESEAVGRHSVDLYEQVVDAVSEHRDVVTANEWLDRDDTFRVAVNKVRPQPSAALPVEIADSGKQSDESLNPSKPTAALADAQNPSPPSPDHAPITPPNEIMPGGSVDRLSVVLAELDSAKIVAFPNVRISSVERLASMYPGGVVGVGQVARLEQGGSHAPLPESLAAFDRYEVFVHSKNRLSNEIIGRMKAIEGEKARTTGVIPQVDLLNQRSAAAASLVKVQGETAETVAELRKIEEPTARQLNALISAYGSACDIISNADQDRLAEICTALKTKADQENGYAESILWTLAEIRRGGDISEASAALVRHAPRMRASNTLRRSVLNLNLTGLLILCETGEDVSDMVRFLKTDAAVRKDAAAMYVVALDAIANRSKFKLEEARRTLRSIRSKVKADTALTGLASAEAIFLELTLSDRQTLEDVAEMRDEVEKYLEQFPNRAARDWQVHQALATIALLEGDRDAASRHVAAGRACAPPFGMKSLDGLSAAIDKGHRYLIVAGE